MYCFGLLVSLLIAICTFGSTIVHTWPVTNPEIVDSLIFADPEEAAQSMREIPQWHCLRYFKHDIHLMRRCRNYRLHMLRRPNDMM
uniref:Secreted protein n=1 Tax=Anopheles atroparvus TaxID=41427 RepID=A0AAG5DEH4_ANOAO